MTLANTTTFFVSRVFDPLAIDGKVNDVDTLGTAGSSPVAQSSVQLYLDVSGTIRCSYGVLRTHTPYSYSIEYDYVHPEHGLNGLNQISNFKFQILSMVSPISLVWHSPISTTAQRTRPSEMGLVSELLPT